MAEEPSGTGGTGSMSKGPGESTEIPAGAASTSEQPVQEEKRKYRLLSFGDARDFVRRLGLPSKNAYQMIARLAAKVAPASPFALLPLRPDTSYAGDFVDWRDYLGPSYLGDGRALPYAAAKAELQPLLLRDEKDYVAYLARTGRRDLPKNPRKVYLSPEHGRAWEGWEDYLGPAAQAAVSHATKRHLKTLPYPKAKEVLAPLSVTSPGHYRALRNSGLLPQGLPARPDHVYASEAHSNIWERVGGWADFLGDSYDQSQSFRSVPPGGRLAYDEARALLAPLRLASSRAYREARRQGRLPPGLPGNPEHYFQSLGTWVNWHDFISKPRSHGLRLMGETTGQAPLLSFEEARKALFVLRLRNRKAYQDMAKDGRLPAGLPLRPEVVYRRLDTGSHWRSWPHFLSSQTRWTSL